MWQYPCRLSTATCRQTQFHNEARPTHKPISAAMVCVLPTIHVSHSISDHTTNLKRRPPATHPISFAHPDWAQPQPSTRVCAHACMDLCEFLVCLKGALVAFSCWRLYASQAPAGTAWDTACSVKPRVGRQAHAGTAWTTAFQPSPGYCHSGGFRAGQGRATPLKAARSRSKPLPGCPAHILQFATAGACR